MKFSTVKEFFHKKICLIKEIFHKKFFLDLGSFKQATIFTQSKNFSGNKDQKGYLKVKSLDLFNIKSYAKIFLTL